MMMARTLLLGGLAVGFAMPAEAQTTSTTPPASSAARTDSTVVPAGELESGANSFTEGQVRSRLEENGFSAITGLRKDDNGFWRATATRGGTSGDVAFDFRGRIAHGPGVATVGPRPAGATTSTAPRDGTAGNPPGTAAGRALDDVAGTNVSGARPLNDLGR